MIRYEKSLIIQRKVAQRLFFLFLIIGTVQAVNVQVYTKDFSPFSKGNIGYSIDYVNTILINIFGNDLTVNFDEKTSNNEMFDAVEAYTDSSIDFSVGIAAISITEDREQRFDFSPAYFESGFQVLTRPDNDFRDIFNQVVIRVLKVFGLILLGSIFLISLLTPLAYFFEFWFSVDKIPIFINWHTRRQENRTTFKLMIFELWNTFLWTTYTFCGTQTGYPSSMGARIVHNIAKLFSRLIVMITIASLSAVMVINFKSSTINGFSDLKGNTVCTVIGTTSQNYLNTHNIGFGVVEKLTVTEMFDSFYSEECSAVVYDFPLLQSSILEREKQGIFDSVIVGPVFHAESYGMIMNPDNPYYEQIKQEFISLNNNHDQINIMKTKWLKKISDVSGKNNVDVPLELIVVPSILGICMTAIAMLILYCNYEDKNSNFEEMRREANDNDYENDLKDVLRQEADNSTIYQGVDQLVDQILVPYVIRNLRVSYEAKLASEGVDVEKLQEGLIPKKKHTFIRKQA